MNGYFGMWELYLQGNFCVNFCKLAGNWHQPILSIFDVQANGQNPFEKFVKFVLILQSLNNLSNLKSLSKCVPHLKFEQMLIRFTSFEELSMKATDKVEKNQG